MFERRVTISNKRGLHARAASRLVEVANRHASDIRVLSGDREADGKNIMSLIMLAASPGTEILLQADGDDAEVALSALVALIENGFDEGE